LPHRPARVAQPLQVVIVVAAALLERLDVIDLIAARDLHASAARTPMPVVSQRDEFELRHAAQRGSDQSRSKGFQSAHFARYSRPTTKRSAL
jgi:hypothetical protein